mmetsp:Transcript_6541/g.19422  ORF Transcript_6541/g.19422 Transcript_6541/m.19422 type:complete len:165 (+) Transcript_6541:122-616(+)
MAAGRSDSLDRPGAALDALETLSALGRGPRGRREKRCSEDLSSECSNSTYMPNGARSSSSNADAESEITWLASGPSATEAAYETFHLGLSWDPPTLDWWHEWDSYNRHLPLGEEHDKWPPNWIDQFDDADSDSDDSFDESPKAVQLRPETLVRKAPSGKIIVSL